MKRLLNRSALLLSLLSYCYNLGEVAAIERAKAARNTKPYDSRATKSPCISKIPQELHAKIEVAKQQFQCNNGNLVIEGEVPSRDNVEAFMPVFRHEMSLYPQSTREKLGIKKILLCENLAMNNQIVAGIADEKHGVLYLNLDDANRHPRFLRHTFHHELFHFIDWRIEETERDDCDWVNLNPSQFEYKGGGYAHILDIDSLADDETLEGFLNKYSMSAVEEDMAEIYTGMVINSPWVEYRAEYDSVIRLKMEKMFKRLQRFDLNLDKSFWSTIKSRNYHLRDLDPVDSVHLESLNGLVDYYSKREQYSETTGMCQRLLQLQERKYGPNHVSFVRSLHKLAWLYQKQNKPEVAKVLYLRAISQARKIGAKNEETNTLRDFEKLTTEFQDGKQVGQ